MSNRKITDMVALTTPASDDVLPIVDISEAAAVDKNKKISIEELFKGAPSGTAAAPSIAFESDGDSGIFLAGTNTVGITTAGTQRVTVDSSGNVGIARSAPDNQLSIGSTASFETDANSFYLGSNFTGTGQNFIGSSKHAQRLFFNNASANGYLSYANTGSAGTAGNAITWQERFRITSDGKLGLGTSSPGFLLDLSHPTNAYIQQTRGSNVFILGPAGDQAADGVLLRTSSNGPLRFDTNGSNERLRITSDGNIGIGTSAPDSTLELAAGPPRLKLTRNTTASTGNDFGRIVFENSAGTILSRIDCESTSGNTQSALTFSNGGSERLRISNNGNVGIGTTSAGANLEIFASVNPQLRVNSTSYGYLDLSNYSNGAGVMTSAAHPLRLGTANTERLRITSDGKLGVGTSSPGQLLHLNSSASTAIQISDGTNNQFISSIKTAGNFANGSTAGDILIRGQSGFAVSPDNGTSVALRIDSSGKILIKGGVLELGVNDVSNGIINAPESLYFNIDSVNGSNNEAFVVATNRDTNAGGSELFRIQDGGNIGIGTSSPNHLLTLKGTQAFQATNSTNAWLAYTYTDNTLRLNYNGAGADEIVVDSSGNVGIGTSSASQKLQVTSGNIFLDGTDQYIYLSNDADQWLSANAASNYIRFGAANQERMRIDSSGRLLVGTTNTYDGEASNLVVASSGHTGITVASTGANQRTNLYFADGTSGAASFVGGFTYDHNDNSLLTRTNGTARFKIDSLGRIDHFSSDGNGYDLHHAETGSTDVAFALRNGATDLDTGTVVFRILADGDLENTNNRYTQISDVKFKENIADASSQWNDLKTIRVVNFNFKEELKWGTQKQIGVVAQEIEAVSPGLVCQRKEENGEEYKSVAYSVLYMKAVKALQEAMERIETLETKVAALEAG